MPSLRIEQSDLMCKNGCKFFGNPQWQGYCSKCHREQKQRQRAASSASTSTLPKPEKKSAQKLTSRSSFSKFEEKRQRQSETLKKANLLKFSMFKKGTAEDQDREVDRRAARPRVPPSVNEKMKRSYAERFPALSAGSGEVRGFAYSLIVDVMDSAQAMSVDELSERVQRHYQHFMKHMETSPHFANVDADTKELLIDFVEKHAMGYLRELPSVVFSPLGTDDERADRLMSERIQQLSWVGEKHLDCKLDRRCQHTRPLLYKAIAELLGMDSARAPGDKVCRVRRAGRHVLRLCSAAARPASADDLLPALIFTVLKANPPRLISNINFVTRFCNAQRLMTGEGGYYFTNLCCAVSFIENLTAESLNMDKEEFDCYMAMPASIGGSSWAATLSLCAELCEAQEQANQMTKLGNDLKSIVSRADELATSTELFQQQIKNKVEDVLAKTPLEVKPRRELPSFGLFKKRGTTQLVDLETNIPPEVIKAPEISAAVDEPTVPDTPQHLLVPTDIKISEDNEKTNILGLEMSEQDKSQTLDQSWGLQHTTSMELLTPSHLGFASFDTRSIDELLTPDDFETDQLPPGLSNVNYDIDLSDFSGENSAADDSPPKVELKDPFSPEGIKNPVFDPFETVPRPRDPFSPILECFDQLTLVDSKMKASDPFELVPRARDPFSPELEEGAHGFIGRDPFSPVPVAGPSQARDDAAAASILDDKESPLTSRLLPSPLLPQNKDKPS